MTTHITDPGLKRIEEAKIEMQTICKAAMEDLVKANEMCANICLIAKNKYKAVVAEVNDLAMKPKDPQ